jgi:hypothetical protein
MATIGIGWWLGLREQRQVTASTEEGALHLIGHGSVSFLCVELVKESSLAGKVPNVAALIVPEVPSRTLVAYFQHLGYRGIAIIPSLAIDSDERVSPSH